MQEELMIPLRASQRRSGDAEDVPAAKHHVTRQALDRRPVMYRVADDAALPDMLPSDLELRLHQSDDFPARGEDAEHRGKDLLERDERHIDDRERGLLAEDPRVEGPRVGVFHHDDALVFSEPRAELARAAVHGLYAPVYGRAPGRARIRNSKMIPARTPPIWATHAVPPVTSPPAAAALAVMSPLANWTTIQRPSTIIAGQWTMRTKKPKMRSMSTLAYGNSRRYAPSTPDTAPLAPTIGMCEPGCTAICASAAATPERR